MNATRILAVLLAVLSPTAAGVRAQSIRPTDDAVKKLAEEVWTLRVDVENMKQQQAAVAGAKGARLDAPKLADNHPVAEPFNALASQGSGKLNAALKEAKAAAKKELDTASDIGRAAFVAQEVQKAREHAAAEDANVTKSAAFLISGDNFLMWAFGLFGLAALAGAAWHDRRHEMRRVMNGGRAKSLGLSRFLGRATAAVAVLTVAVYLGGNFLYSKIGPKAAGGPAPFAALEDEKATLAAKHATLREELKRVYEVKEEDAWATARREAVEWAGLTHARDWAAKVSRGYQDKAKEIAEGLKAKGEQASSQRSTRVLLQALAGTATCAALGGLGLTLARQQQARRKRMAAVCPMCLTNGKLKGEKGSSGGQVRCQVDGCELKFPRMYKALPKLCFPTLGNTVAGKTTWLAMTYRELTHGRYEADVAFKTVQSSTPGIPSMTEYLDALVDGIYEQKVDAEATRATGDDRVPPFMFNFRDADPYGPSNMLVNVFDYSGEVTKNSQRYDLMSQVRQRALDANGYLFFLDPTIPSVLQIKMVNRFQADVQTLRGKAAGEAISAPVALVVPKIDLVAFDAQGRPRTQAVKFVEELTAIDEKHPTLTLDKIARRSAVTARYRDVFWKGWEVERQMSETFGGRVMYFPLTPIGLNEPGEDRLVNRTIEPYAVLEPLLWLIHMNGYPVLK